MAGGLGLDTEDGAAVLRGEVRRILGTALSRFRARRAHV